MRYSSATGYQDDQYYTSVVNMNTKNSTGLCCIYDTTAAFTNYNHAILKSSRKATSSRRVLTEQRKFSVNASLFHIAAIVRRRADFHI